MANIRDVAKLSGHAVSTVSRALNHQGYLAEQTRKEIMAAVKQLDYHRNGLARALSIGKTNQVGVILPYINHPYFQKLADAITDIGFMNGYQVTMMPTNYSQERERHYLDMLKHHLVDGIIFTSRSIAFHDILPYRDYGPIVCCEDTFEYPIASVFTNRGESFVHAFQILKQCGLQHVGVTISRNEHVSQSAKLTLQAYSMVYGPGLDDQLIFRDTKNMFDGITAAEQFLKADPQLQVIFANGDEIAAGAQRQLANQQHPAIVIGQENLPVSFLMDFPTIDHQLTTIGDTAFELLFKAAIEKKQVAAKLILRGQLKNLVATQNVATTTTIDKIIDA